MREIKVGNVTLGADERQGILKVIANNWISPGPFVEEFEQKFSAYHDCMFGVMVNSGTDALRIALSAMKEKYAWSSDREVIVPALTFVATVNIILQCGLKPVFVDVSPVDLNIDVDKLNKAITFKTCAILPVHLFGNPANMDAISHIAQAHRLKVLEDSCETMGVRHRDQMVGSLGDAGAFSTYSCHLIQTGVGGIATTNDEYLYNLMRSYMNHGRRSESRADRFTFDRIGFSSRPDEFQAAIGLAQLKNLHAMLNKRRVNAVRLSDALENQTEHIWTLSPHEMVSEKAWMIFPCVLNDKSIDRDAFCSYLEEWGIETRPLFPLLTQPCYKDVFNAEDFPVALKASSHGFYVGCHQDLSIYDMDYVGERIEIALKVFQKKSVAA